MRTFLTSDTHFRHRNIIQYCNRPFDTVSEMNHEMIHNWNSVVRDGDRVVHCGDFGFGSASALKDIVKFLNGSITLLVGNHDKAILKVLPHWQWVLSGECDGVEYVMAHKPEDARACGVNPGTLYLHGHTHNSTPKFGKDLINLSVEHWDYTPVLLTEAIAQWKEWRESVYDPA